MGRPKLRRAAANVDLSHHFRSIDELPSPFCADALFGRTGPLEIEVGSGKGLFLSNAAATFPDNDFLGIEIAQQYARLAAAGLGRRGLTNALVVAGDAVRIFAEILPEAIADAVHIYFPDPWWKRRHRKRRVVQDAFVRDVARVLKPGGLLHYWTDVEEYFVAGVKVIASQADLEGPFDVPEPPTTGDFDYRTHFERRTRRNGGRVHRAEFRKRLGHEGAVTKTE